MNTTWTHKRRYNAYSNHMKEKHGKRVQKVSIDAGFTCPNRDGKVAFGGCTYCNNDSFNPSYCDPSKPILQQIDDGIEFLSRRYKTDKYVAYFQAYSNTYGSLDEIVRLYDEALSHPEIIGLVIGTRPDCIDEHKLIYFSELSKKYDVTIEYGIESCNDETLKTINRGHTFQQTVDAIELTAKYGINVSAHLIFGLPGESREYMLSEASIVSKLPINSIKLHQLHIVKKTVMSYQFRETPDFFNLFTLDEYLEFIVSFLELLRPDIVVQRLFGEAPPYIMAGPTWGELRNHDVLELIEKKLEERDTYQGRLYKKSEINS